MALPTDFTFYYRRCPYGFAYGLSLFIATDKIISRNITPQLEAADNDVMSMLSYSYFIETFK